MTIIVAFILEAFVFRMNYSRKNQDSEGLCKELEQEHLLAYLSAWLAGWLASCWLFDCPVQLLIAQPSIISSYLCGLFFWISICIDFQII